MSHWLLMIGTSVREGLEESQYCNILIPQEKGIKKKASRQRHQDKGIKSKASRQRHQEKVIKKQAYIYEIF